MELTEKLNVKTTQIEFNREWEYNHKDKDGKDTSTMIYYFNITLDDGTTGEFSTNKREQTKFEEGKSYDITIEVKTNTRGEYNKIDIKKEPYKGGNKYDPEVQAQIVRSVAIECAINTVTFHSTMDTDTYGILTRDYNAWINSKGKGIQSSINAQAALKRAVMTVQNENTMIYDDIIVRADKYCKYINKG